MREKYTNLVTKKIRERERERERAEKDMKTK